MKIEEMEPNILGQMVEAGDVTTSERTVGSTVAKKEACDGDVGVFGGKTPRFTSFVKI